MRPAHLPTAHGLPGYHTNVSSLAGPLGAPCFGVACASPRLAWGQGCPPGEPCSCPLRLPGGQALSLTSQSVRCGHRGKGVQVFIFRLGEVLGTALQASLCLWESGSFLTEVGGRGRGDGLCRKKSLWPCPLPHTATLTKRPSSAATAHFSFCRTLLEHTVSAESIPYHLPRTPGTSLTWHDSRSQRAVGSRPVKLLQQPGTEDPQVPTRQTRLGPRPPCALIHLLLLFPSGPAVL